MRRIARCTAAIAAVAGTTLLLIGCGKSDSAPARDVTVVGTGQVRAAPDILNADLGVEVNADNVSTAISGDYQATNTVHAVVRDLSKASAILASAVKAGGNETRLRGVLFAFDDDSRLLADARSRAFADAKSRAEQYAVLAGLKLTDVVTINEVSSRDENPKNPGAHRGGGFLRVRTRHPEGDFHRKSPGAWADYCQFGSVTTCAA